MAPACGHVVPAVNWQERLQRAAFVSRPARRTQGGGGGGGGGRGVHVSITHSRQAATKTGEWWESSTGPLPCKWTITTVHRDQMQLCLCCLLPFSAATYQITTQPASISSLIHQRPVYFPNNTTYCWFSWCFYDIFYGLSARLMVFWPVYVPTCSHSSTQTQYG